MRETLALIVRDHPTTLMPSLENFQRWRIMLSRPDHFCGPSVSDLVFDDKLAPRASLLIEQAAELLIGRATSLDAYRLFASLSRERPRISSGALLKLADAHSWQDEQLVALAQLALSNPRFEQLLSATPCSFTRSEWEAKFLLLRAASAMLRGSPTQALQYLENAKSDVSGLVATRLKWLAAYVRAARNDPQGVGSRSLDAVTTRWASYPSDPNNITFALMDYKSPDLTRVSVNIGDYIQTLAVLRHLSRFVALNWHGLPPELANLLTRLSGTWRLEKLSKIDGNVSLAVLDRDMSWPAAYLYRNRVVWTIINGWFYHRPFDSGSPFPYPKNIEPIIVSFHLAHASDLSETILSWLKAKAPIGCRDWSTTEWLINAGVDAFFSGCLTLSLEMPAPPVRHGRYFVDVAERSASASHTDITISHHSETLRGMPLARALEEAVRLMDIYAAAEQVVTSRLHCYLPCQALKTPVEFVPKLQSDRRFRGLTDTPAAAAKAVSDATTIRIEQVLGAIFSGGSRQDIRRLWQELNSADVLTARARVESTVGVAIRRPAAASNPSFRRQTPAEVVLAISFDERIAPQVPTMLRSVRANTTATMKLVALTRELAPAQISDLIAPLKCEEVRQFDMTERTFDLAPELSSKTTISTMDRLFLPELLPDVDKIVYLDIDVAVLGDIRELAAFEPSSRGVAARPTGHIANLAQAIERKAKLLDCEDAAELRRWAAAGTNLRSQYFNAGVLVLSLQQLRKRKMTARAMQLVKRFGVHDQDALNLYCGGDFAVLPDEWNAMPYVDWCESPKILHWVGVNKPWARGRKARFAEVWHRHVAKQEPVTPGSKEHWLSPTSYPRAWDERASLAAHWLDKSVRLLDLGSGPRFALKQLLPQGSTYIAADLRAWVKDVQVVDLDLGQFPIGTFDVVAALNVIEYLNRPGIVFRKARRAAPQLIVSYCHPRKGCPTQSRRQRGWKNAFTEAAFARLLAEAGWSIVDSKPFDEDQSTSQVIYRAVHHGHVINSRHEKERVEPDLGLVATRVRSERLTYLRPEKMARLEHSIMEVLSDGIAGDFVEFGVALGGSAIVIADQAVRSRRRFFGFDVFAMIPPPNAARDGPDAQSRYDTIAAGTSQGIRGDIYYGYRTDLLSEVRANFERLGVPIDDEKVCLIPGRFENTIRTADLGPLAIVHIDCDWFDSVSLCLNTADRLLVAGGIVVVDDYHNWSGCKAAVDEFLARRADFVKVDGPNLILRRSFSR